MPFVQAELRRLVESFSPQSRAYWEDVGRTLLGPVAAEQRLQVRTFSSRLVRACGSVLGAVAAEAFPVLACVRFERRLRPRIEEAKGNFDLPDYAAKYLEVEKDQLKDSHKIEVTRKEQFNRKAQAYLMGVTLATSFAVGILGVYAKAGGGVPTPLKVVLVAVVLTLLMSAGSALRVIAPSEAFDQYLQTRNVAPPEGDESIHEKSELVKITLLNQGHNLIAANYLAASFVGMRNGLALVGIVLLWAIIAS